MMGSINGPIIPDLRERLGTSMETISFILAFSSLGNPFGSILGGMVSDRYHRLVDLVLVASLLLAGISTILKGYIYNLPLLAFICFVAGMGFGGIDAGGP